MSAGRAWTQADDTRLVAMIEGGDTHTLIAETLGRPKSSIPSRLQTLRRRGALAPFVPKVKDTGESDGDGEHADQPPLHIPGKTKRPCLCCKKPFWSEGAHNRLCGCCRNKPTGPFDF